MKQNTTSVESPNLKKLLTKIYQNKWVAISSNYKKVLSFSDNLTALQKKVGDADVIYIKPLPSDMIFSPISYEFN